MSQERPRAKPIGAGDHPAYGRYVFDHSEKNQAAERLRALAVILDPGTQRHLNELGVGKGWRCLEVGAGGGSIAAWLGERVGLGGHVLATDIDTRLLETRAKGNLEVRRHDLVSDALPESAFDLVHARLVLMHLPEREEVLGRLVAALKPGGWILLEEFDSLSIRSDPSVNPVEPPFKAYAAMQQVFADRGVNMRYGRLLMGRLRAHRLADVGSEGRMFMWQGRSMAASLLRTNFEQLRSAIIGTGSITAAELDEDLALLNDENFLIPSPVMWAAWGRRPARGT